MIKFLEAFTIDDDDNHKKTDLFRNYSIDSNENITKRQSFKDDKGKHTLLINTDFSGKFMENNQVNNNVRRNDNHRSYSIATKLKDDIAKTSNEQIRKVGTERTTVIAYDLVKLLINNGHNFAVINDNLHYYIEDHGYYKFLIGSEEEKIIRRIIPEKLKKLVNGNMINETIKWLKSSEEIVVDDNEITIGLRDYINFENGVLHVPTGKRFKHSPLRYFTNYVRAEYPFDFKCEGKYFKRFIKQVTNGDQEIEFLLQEVLGIIISEIRDIKAAFFFVGLPNTGKSKLIETVRSIVGEQFCSNISLHELNERFKLALLFGKKLNTFVEINEFDLKRLDIFKSITGNDPVTAEYKGKDPFSFINRALLVFGGNHLPNLKAMDITNAFFERIVIVPFMNSVPREKQDLQLYEKLFEERSFIVKWAVEGLQRFIENGYIFTDCTASNKMKDSYIAEQNSFRAFINTECILGPEFKTYSLDILDEYQAYCEYYGLPPVPKKLSHKILQTVFNLKYSRFKQDGENRNGYIGIKLKDNNLRLRKYYNISC